MTTANVYPIFKKEINVAYPSGNKPIFEEWFDTVYEGCKTDRIYLPIFWTSYYVNNDYGKNEESLKQLHFFLTDLDKSKRYFTIIQYDDGSMIDWELLGLDVLEFNMSKQKGCMIPLLCQPHPYKFDNPKKYLASFVGSRTHPIRNELEKLKDKEGYYISFEPHDIETYCRILHESVFTLCPRGYGSNSFRIAEAMQYQSIPVYISDEFIRPFGNRINNWMVVVHNNEINELPEILQGYDVITNLAFQKNYYDKYYTYEGCFKHIIKYLETEYSDRKQV